MTAARHFGDLVREQRELAAGAAVVPLDDRGVLQLTGADRLSWLDSITSQAVGRMQPGESAELLVLDPNGRIEHTAAIATDEDAAWLIADAGDLAGLERWLTMMRFRADVDIIRPDARAFGTIAGGAAEPALRGVAQVVWTDPWPAVAVGGWQYATTDAHPGSTYRWMEAVVTGGGADDLPRAGSFAADALRIAAWRPRWANEVDERAIPHELDWLRTAVHLDKGCYRGQETVAKVHNLGHPPRRLVMLHLDGTTNTLPARGDAVVDLDGAPVGAVTSAARHHELGPIALAIVSRRTPEDQELRVQSDGVDVAAAQEVIVPADAGRTANIPKMPRLAARQRQARADR